jgi:CelD/BcsL family acetyltransferase involved in cellulose biosynthesis
MEFKSGSAPWDEALRRTGAAWPALASRVGANPTALPGWIGISLAALQPEGEVRAYLHFVDGALQAVVPYRRTKRKFFGIPLRLLDLNVSVARYHYDFAAQSPPAATLAACLADARGPGWDLAFAGNVVVGSPFHAALLQMNEFQSCIVVRYPAETSPYLPLERSWEELVSTKQKKFRYNIRRRASDFSLQRGYVMSWFGEGADTERLLAHMLVIERGSWKARVGRAISDSTTETAYHRALLPWLARSGFLRANVLYRRSDPVAYNLCCRYGAWCGQLKTSFLESEASGSPGAHVIDAAIQDAIGADCTEFDFLGDADSHKLAWSKAVRTHEDVFLFRKNASAGPIGVLKALMRLKAKRSKQGQPASE